MIQVGDRSRILCEIQTTGYTMMRSFYFQKLLLYVAIKVTFNRCIVNLQVHLISNIWNNH